MVAPYGLTAGDECPPKSMGPWGCGEGGGHITAYRLLHLVGYRQRMLGPEKIGATNWGEEVSCRVGDRILWGAC